MQESRTVLGLKYLKEGLNYGSIIFNHVNQVYRSVHHKKIWRTDSGKCQGNLFEVPACFNQNTDIWDQCI